MATVIAVSANLLLMSVNLAFAFVLVSHPLVVDLNLFVAGFCFGLASAIVINELARR